MIELKDAADEDSPGWSQRLPGWSPMTSSDWPFFLTPLTYHQSDWQLIHVDLRMNLSF